MRNPARTVLLAAFVLSSLPGQRDPDPAPAGEVRLMLNRYHPTEGTVKVGSVAEAKLPEGWLWLAGPNARKFLTDLGNQPGPQVIGVAMPPDFEESRVFAVYSYVDEGYIKDDEAPDYDDLLAEMKDSALETSKQRKKAGLGGVELWGWAEPPHYDKTQHKLYWAEKLKFDENEGLTLNYNVRVLGRAGHLVVNGVGDFEQLELVATHSKHLLSVTEFLPGQRYENFDPAYDKVAAYGIGGLIAGKMALKSGLLKVLIKPILVGLVVIGGLLAKLFTGRKAETEVKPADAS
ncbi:MAG TPA: DUF2167 domain-containing protein [Planctomycetota bacterium]